MSDAVLLSGVGLIGILLGALISYKRARAAVQREIDRADQRTSQAVTIAKEQAGSEIQRLEHEAAGLRTKVEQERQAVHAVHTKAKVDLIRVQAERGKLLIRHEELTNSLKELRAQTDESMKELEQLHEIANSLRQLLEQMESRLLTAARRVKELSETRAS